MAFEIEALTTPPKEITPAYLNVVVMPNGEIICHGKTVGWVKQLQQFLYVDAKVD